MSNRRLVNCCLMGAVLAVPATLFGLYQLGFAQEPPEPPGPRLLRIAQAEPKVSTDNDQDLLDIPGGVLIGMADSKAVRESVGVGSCIRCHAAKSSVSQKLEGFGTGAGEGPQDDNWALLNEAATWANADKHHGSYVALLNERSQKMAKVLGIVDKNGNSLVHRDVRCIACHSGIPLRELEMDLDAEHPGLITEAMVKEETLNRGVSCEGCHGVAGETNELDGWETEHISKKRWRFMDPKYKAEHYGYYDIRSPVLRTRMCLSCHLGNVKEGRVVTHEMFAAGHPPLPGFELETFSLQEPQHWRNFHEKSKDIRDEFLERTEKRVDPDTNETVGWRTGEWRPDDLHNTRDLLIGSVVNLSELLRLTLDMADPNVTVPVGDKKWSSGTEDQWPELSLFACYACHHDLQDNGWRLKRKPIGTPGRPPLHEWPFALAKYTIKNTGDGNQKLLDQIRDVQLASVDGPFGNKPRLMVEGRKLIQALDSYALQLETMPLPKNMGPDLLDGLVEIARNHEQALDYDSARQIAWAFRIIYEDYKGISPTDEELYVDKKLERNGWYDAKNMKLDPVQRGLATFSDLMLMDLREGSRANQKIDGQERPFLQWDATLALPPVGAYDPESFLNKLMELKTQVSK